MVTAAKRAIESRNPATGEVVARYGTSSQEEVDQTLDKAWRAHPDWADRSVAERAEAFRRAATYLRENARQLSQMITVEMGKPITQSEAEIEKCAWSCEHYADNAARYLANQPHPSGAAESYVAFDPLGVVLAIMPWNFPFWQVFRFAAPALMAGNTAVLKHASNVSGCALAIEEVFTASGFPPGVFQTLLVPGSAAEELVADPRIAAVTLTGSEHAGGRVGGAAGRAIKKAVMELGGSDPLVVLEDADLDRVVPAAVWSRFQNAGQSCIAAKRLIVVDAVADAFLARFSPAVAALRVGDPLDRSTEVGPLARADLRDALDRQVRESVRMGASVETGGHPLPGHGWYYAPTVLSGVTRAMPVFEEETFGPAAAVVRVANVEAAIAAANDTQYGLGAQVWTRDVERARILARRIAAGSVFVNGVVASDPRLPFGGIKRSGYGRELSEYGIYEFTNVKSIWIGPATQPPARPARTE